MYNLNNIVYTELISSIHVPGDIGIAAMRDIPNETDPFILYNIPKNPGMVLIRESSLHTIPEHVSDHLKKFVIPHVTNDGEKEYPLCVMDLGWNTKFLVKTTSDANQSNCKFMQDSGYIRIMTTRLIKKGDELLLFYEFPCSDLEKKSTRDKRKQRDELSEDDRREIAVLDDERRHYEVQIAMAKRDVEFWEKQIKEIVAKEYIILRGGDELSEDNVNETRILVFERRQYITKIEIATSDFECVEKLIQEITSKKNVIFGGGGGGGDIDHKRVKSEVGGLKGES